MAALDFLRRSHDVLVLHYNHGTNHGQKAQELVRDYCLEHGIEFTCETNSDVCPKGESLENFWRIKRYNFFEKRRQERSVITCHHLDDVIETWIFTALNGTPYLIPGSRDFYIRPFLMTKSKTLKDWCHRKDVPYVNDPSNLNTRFMRNYIRHELVSKAMVVNPGLHKTIRKKLAEASCAQIVN